MIRDINIFLITVDKFQLYLLNTGPSIPWSNGPSTFLRCQSHTSFQFSEIWSFDQNYIYGLKFFFNFAFLEFQIYKRHKENQRTECKIRYIEFFSHLVLRFCLSFCVTLHIWSFNFPTILSFHFIFTNIWSFDLSKLDVWSPILGLWTLAFWHFNHPYLVLRSLFMSFLATFNNNTMQAN